MSARALLVLGLGVAAAALLARSAQATQPELADIPPADFGALDAPEAAGFFYDVPDIIAMQQPTSTASTEGNISAFLAMIAAAEGTDQRADSYRVCYGYGHTIASFADHPAVTGEWRGAPLDNLGPAYRGKISTAAGRYQIIKPTWVGLRDRLGLQDFGPAAQDAAAVQLIRQRGALADVQAGRIAQAISKCRAEWASLPGAGYGQPERKLAALLGEFEAAGGALA